MNGVLILGGYGNFGKRIARALAGDGVPVVIAGRSREKAEALAATLPGAQAAVFNVNNPHPSPLPQGEGTLAAALQRIQPAIVVNTCGPFQGADYSVAEACIAHGVHYIDLADGREFVTGITALDAKAKAAGVAVISGASTVPGLSSAVVEHFLHEFSAIDELIYGISPGQKAERGLATTQGILTYVGKPLAPFAGHACAYGWQDIYRQDYPGLGKRWMGNCEIPDLDLLPKRYGIKSIRFSAGLELGLEHLGLWALSWLVRLGLPLDLPHFAAPLLRMADALNGLGSADGGMHMILRGKGGDGKPYERRWFIVARDGYGPHIPTIPAILLAKRLVSGAPDSAGAYPCVGLIALQDYLDALKKYPIITVTQP